MRTELAIRDLVPDPDLSYRNESASRLHRRAQATLSRRYKSFRSEVPLTGNVDLGSRSITVTGRLDGLRRARSGVCLYEIKSVPEPARDWIHSPTLQRARWQLLLYGDLYRLVFDGTPGRLILLLIDPAGRIAEEDIDPSSCRGLLSRRLPTIQRDSSRPGPFPEPIVSQLQRFIADDHRHDREIQTEALRSVAQHPDSDRLLFAMPPGSGKTRIALRIALEAAARDRLPVHWITMKSEGRQTVLNELDRYRAAGLSLRHVWKAPP